MSSKFGTRGATGFEGNGRSVWWVPYEVRVSNFLHAMMHDGCGITIRKCDNESVNIRVDCENCSKKSVCVRVCVWDEGVGVFACMMVHDSTKCCCCCRSRVV